MFNIMPSSSSSSRLSLKEMFRTIVKDGAQKGVHTLIWQDGFNALYQNDKDIMSYFSMKIAFDMSPEEYSRFVSANDVSLMSENSLSHNTYAFWEGIGFSSKGKWKTGLYKYAIRIGSAITQEGTFTVY